MKNPHLQTLSNDERFEVFSLKKPSWTLRPLISIPSRCQGHELPPLLSSESEKSFIRLKNPGRNIRTTSVHMSLPGFLPCADSNLTTASDSRACPCRSPAAPTLLPGPGCSTDQFFCCWHHTAVIPSCTRKLKSLLHREQDKLSPLSPLPKKPIRAPQTTQCTSN